LTAHDQETPEQIPVGNHADPVEITFDGLVIRFADGEVVRFDPFGVRVVLPIDRLVDLLRLKECSPADSLVSVKEKAVLLGVDEATIYRHARELGGEKVGGVWRFPRHLASTADEPPKRGTGAKKKEGRRTPGKRVRTLDIRGKRLAPEV
jgi:predicted DNA-binding transcriptional regulator AlpA